MKKQPHFNNEYIIDNEENECAICLEPMQHNIQPLLILRCNHKYHDKCIREWFKAKKSNKCPICNN